jgi:hypothetical protein
LIKTAHQHLLLLVGFDTLIYRKYYDTPPILVGHQRAIDTFLAGLRRSDLVEEIGRTRSATVAKLMEEANKFANGEDAYNNKRGRSPEVDRASRQRRQYCSRDNQGRRNLVAAGYKAREEEGYENRRF